MITDTLHAMTDDDLESLACDLQTEAAEWAKHARSERGNRHIPHAYAEHLDYEANLLYASARVVVAVLHERQHIARILTTQLARLDVPCDCTCHTWPRKHHPHPGLACHEVRLHCGVGS